MSKITTLGNMLTLDHLVFFDWVPFYAHFLHFHFLAFISFITASFVAGRLWSAINAVNVHVISCTFVVHG
jgi:hypothetical protein